MTKSPMAKAREERQGRVGKVVWGLAFVAAGVILTMANLGMIDIEASSPYPAEQAVDGNLDTRWSSAFADPQSITIDLGSVRDITRVKLHWEASHAKEYRIQVSNDGATWAEVVDVTDGDGGIDEHEVSARGRFVRMAGRKRSSPYGYSLWELEVYGPTGSDATEAAALLSAGRPVVASSREQENWREYWFTYWPILMMLGGLPALLAPKDGSDQITGLIVTGLGIFFQARQLGYTDWGFAQVSPVVFLLVGLILVVQSIRPTGGTETKTGGPEAGGEAAR